MRAEPPVLVREGTPQDAASISDVHAEAWRVGHRDLFEEPWLARFVSQRRGMWPGVLTDPGYAGSTLLVAERGHRVVAFSGFGRSPHKRGDGELYALYAHPSVWGTGVARTLMDSTWDALAAERFIKVRLWTVAGANRARRFYLKAGFAESGARRERDYGDGRPVLEVEYTRWGRPLTG